LLVAAVAQATQVVDNVRYLTQEVQRLLAVVVLDQRGLLDRAQRQANLDAALALLAEVAATSPAPVQGEVARVHTVLQAARPTLLTIVDQVDQVQQDLTAVLPPERQALLGWAWCGGRCWAGRGARWWRRSRWTGRRARGSCWRRGRTRTGHG
jgi:hypothetical protein